VELIIQIHLSGMAMAGFLPIFQWLIGALVLCFSMSDNLLRLPSRGAGGFSRVGI